MFATSQIQTRSRLHATKKATGNDENAKVIQPKSLRDKVGKEAHETTFLGAKKRAALGDVSNVQSLRTNVAHAKITKPRLTRSQLPTAKATKPSTTEVIPKISKSSAIVPSKTKKVDASQSVAVVPESRQTKTIKSTIVAKKKVEVAVVSKSTSIVTKTTQRVKVRHTVPEEDNDTKKPVLKKAKTVDWEDLDAEDGYDPIMVAEYVQEIFEYMQELEMQTMPNPNYMEVQKELQWKMRSILVDWLVEVHHKFRLLPETLYMTINLIDRFLSVRVVSLVKLQLVGVTAMFVASKYEEVIAPSIQNFLYMADGGYTDEEILKAERYLLQVLDFSLQYPSPMSFLRRCSKADQYDIQTRTLAKYLMEISLIDHRFLKMPPSMISAAGLYLARHMLDRGEWHANLVHYSGYEEEEIFECCDLILDYLSRPTKYEALYKKYSTRKFMKASIFVKDWIARQGADYRLTPSSPVASSSELDSERPRTNKKHVSNATEKNIHPLSETETSQHDNASDSSEL